MNKRLVLRLAASLGVVSLLAGGCSSGDNGASPAVSAQPATTATATVTRTEVPVTPAASPVGSPWSTKAPLPEANSETAVAEVNGKVYVIGGYPSSRMVTNAVQVYDIAQDRWQLTQPLPAALHHVMAAGVNGKLYAIGGETAGSGATLGQTPAGGGGFVNTVFEYDPGTAMWARKSPMPTARSGGATAVIDGRIYVAGGRPPGGADFAVYEPASDRWMTLPNMPTQRNHLAVAALGGKVYVAGGRFGGGVGSEMTAIVEAFDPATNRWERKASMLSPRAGVNGIAARGCFYVFGGEGNDADPRGVFSEMEVFNPGRDDWSKLEPLPTPVHGVTGAAFADGWIHLMGGGTSRGGSSGTSLHQVFRADVAC